jgi:hypothetical protein
MSDHFKRASSATSTKSTKSPIIVEGACWGSGGSAVQVLR